MPSYTDYKCGKCHKPTERELLIVKRAVFVPIGRGAKIVKNRTIMWLCDDCLKLDPDWNRESHDAPGLKSVTRENVRELRRQMSEDI
jgi:hypothetical protein